jgi:outer membrane protein OmpA-like peptidoglycan-associated protein
MKKNVRIVGVILMAAATLTSCSNMNNTGKGALIGTGGGALLGTIIGAIADGNKGAAIGAAIGAGVGAGTGAIIGKKMDKQQAELAKIEGAQVESITDKNDLQAIKVTFSDGILFNTGKTTLSTASRNALNEFAASLKANPGTDVTIYGHTDNTGSRQINEKLSLERANAVVNFLVGNGIERGRFTAEGLAYDQPVADNSTAEGRAQNRRVEIYITASAAMIEQANKEVNK